MEYLQITGGRRLTGSVTVEGAKNSALPILAATIINGGESVIRNCPALRDVDSATAILTYLGCKIRREGDNVIVDSSTLSRCDIPDKLMREMRSSVIFLGAILARAGRADMSYPGGCELGPRPIDLHIKALRTLGADIVEEGGKLTCTAQSLSGADINLSFPSVGATENTMLAAACARGRTRIFNAAREPEIEDLQNFLSGIGVKISGAGTSIIEIEGGTKFTDVDHTVIPDRIVAATYMCAAAITGGKILIKRVQPSHFTAASALLSEAGCNIRVFDDSLEISRDAEIPLRAVRQIRTMPYPGFPTDIQSPVMSVMSVARGVSVFYENIFENRYRHVSELERMGADIKVAGKLAVVLGVERLTGARVHCTDLRGGAALVVAALAAEGETEIFGIEHVDRGYEAIENRLSGLSAEVKRRNTDESQEK